MSNFGSKLDNLPHRRDRGRQHRLLSRRGSSDFVPGNQITLLQNGAAYFPAIEKAFDQARHQIYLETYIYRNDATGQLIANALQRAAQRGVKVYVLIDGYGSKDLAPGMLMQLRADGIMTLIYRPEVSPWMFQRKRLRRMHRKIVVVDRDIAFVGGINITDDMDASGDMASRFDYAVAVEGPLVDVIRNSVQLLWLRVARSAFHLRKIRDGTFPVASSTGGSIYAAFVVRDNFRHRRDIESAYIGAIERAQSEIILAHAYFLPGHEFRHALIRAAERGVRVALLLQGKIEYVVEHFGSRALYGSFLDAGIEIFEYRKSFLHAKVAIIDGHWATVGSSNIDPFSLLLSREANVVIDDKGFGATLRESLKKAMEIGGQQIVMKSWKQQPVHLRIFSWICYGLLRLMKGISGYDRHKLNP